MNRVTTIRRLRSFLRQQSGATAIEYAIIAAGVASAIVVTISLLGGSVLNLWTRASAALG